MMSETEGQRAIRRVLVAVDASPHSLSALEAAGDLAANLEAELEGLFVEDHQLLELTRLPCAREVSFYSATCRRLDPKALERELRVQAERIRGELARVARKARTPWRFRVSHGQVAEEILQAAAESDLFLLGKVGSSLAGPRRLGSTVQRVVREHSGLTMIFQQGGSLRVPVLVLYSGSELSRRALRMAVKVFHPKWQPMTILIPAADRSSFAGWETEVEGLLRESGMTGTCRLIMAPDLRTLAQVVRLEGSGPLVVPCEGLFVDSDAIHNLINEIPNPVLVVREGIESPAWRTEQRSAPE